VLYSADMFEPLTGAHWNEAQARQGIRAIVADVEAAYRGPRLLWKADSWDGWRATSPMKNLYVGAAGVIWGLDRLRARGYAQTSLELASLATGVHELFALRPDFMKGIPLPPARESSLACGAAGVAFVAWKLTRQRDLDDELHALVRANATSDVDEVMWGAPGTLVIARTMAAETSAERWCRLRDETAEALWSRRETTGCWVQRLYGEEYRGLQTWHGLVGNVCVLAPALDETRRERLLEESANILEQTAVIEDGLANWPFSRRPELVSPDGQVRLQFCCGAPGVVATASGYLAEELVLAGAELAWTAGPPGLEKGPCVCHGTAGTGHAFLAAFARTGDELWLDRARSFAMHALEQVQRRGRGRYSLFTGDIGVALYAADCIDCRSELPVFDAL
jgi:Lanthionine synthetase C-like protein